MSTYLSTNFTLEEATFSQTASRMGIDNDPSIEILDNMKRAAYGMEEVRKELGNHPILVSSWYRGEPLEKVITEKDYAAWCKLHGYMVDDYSWAKYFAGKAHPKGHAVDFTCSQFGTVDEIVQRLMASAIKFKKVIREYGRWVHIDFGGDDRIALIIDQTGTRAYA